MEETATSVSGVVFEGEESQQTAPDLELIEKNKNATTAVCEKFDLPIVMEETETSASGVVFEGEESQQTTPDLELIEKNKNDVAACDNSVGVSSTADISSDSAVSQDGQNSTKVEFFDILYNATAGSIECKFHIPDNVHEHPDDNVVLLYARDVADGEQQPWYGKKLLQTTCVPNAKLRHCIFTLNDFPLFNYGPYCFLYANVNLYVLGRSEVFKIYMPADELKERIADNSMDGIDEREESIADNSVDGSDDEEENIADNSMDGIDDEEENIADDNMDGIDDEEESIADDSMDGGSLQLSNEFDSEREESEDKALAPESGSFKQKENSCGLQLTSDLTKSCESENAEQSFHQQEVKYHLNFRNNNLLCWLNSAMSLLIHCKKLNNEKNNSSLASRILKDYENTVLAFNHCLSKDNVVEKLRTAENVLNTIQNYALRYLKPIMNYIEGRPDSALCSLLNLIQENEGTKYLFRVKYSLIKSCNNCAFSHVSNCEKTIMTLPKVRTFMPDSPASLYNCSRCQAVNQEFSIEYKTLPQCLIFHFENGAGEGSIKPFEFTIQNRTYQLTGLILIQKFKYMDHFVTWVRDVVSDFWLERNCLEPPVVMFSQDQSIELKSVFMFMYEATDNYGTISVDNAIIREPSITETDQPCFDIIDLSDDEEEEENNQTEDCLQDENEPLVANPVQASNIEVMDRSSEFELKELEIDTTNGCLQDESSENKEVLYTCPKKEIDTTVGCLQDESSENKEVLSTCPKYLVIKFVSKSEENAVDKKRLVVANKLKANYLRAKVRRIKFLKKLRKRKMACGVCNENTNKTGKTKAKTVSKKKLKTRKLSPKVYKKKTIKKVGSKASSNKAQQRGSYEVLHDVGKRRRNLIKCRFCN